MCQTSNLWDNWLFVPILQCCVQTRIRLMVLVHAWWVLMVCYYRMIVDTCFLLLRFFTAIMFLLSCIWLSKIWICRESAQSNGVVSFYSSIFVPACLELFHNWETGIWDWGWLPDLGFWQILAECRQSVVIGHVYIFACQCAGIRIMPEFEIQNLMALSKMKMVILFQNIKSSLTIC